MKLNVDDREVFATTGGADLDPRRPAVIFLHGAGFDRTTWRLQTRWFAHHGRSVLAVDFPGHGWSQGLGLDSIAAMADWTARLIDAVGLKSAALVGHSMGALVAPQLSPTRVLGANLIAARNRVFVPGAIADVGIVLALLWVVAFLNPWAQVFGTGDLRAVQEMLGHAHIGTTQVYTRLDYQHLAKAYDAAHPRARRKTP